MGNISTHFNRKEFECKCGCKFGAVDVELLRLLEEVREYFGKPVNITSACRCDSHNKKVGGSPKSQHKQARAADIVIKDIHPDKVYAYFDSRYPTQYGMGSYDSFTHIDTRDYKARW